jgi:hypothetical protein
MGVLVAKPISERFVAADWGDMIVSSPYGESLKAAGQLARPHSRGAV